MRRNRQRIARPAAVLMLAATLTAIVACSDRVTTSPDAAKTKQAGANVPVVSTDTSKPRTDTGATKPDTGKPKPDTGETKPDTGDTPPDTGSTPPDTGSAPPPDTGGTSGPDTTRTDAFIRGTVVGIDSSTGRPVTFTPLKGVAVTVFPALPIGAAATNDSGSPRRDSVTAATTNDEGHFAFKGLRGGYYTLRVVPPAGSGYGGVRAYPAVAWSEGDLVLRVPLVIYLHKK